MDKKSKNTMIVSVIALALVLIGVTYAYFSARITGLESASTISLTAGRMGIVYSEDDATVSVSNIYPREEAWITKQITLTGYNTTDQSMAYDLGLNIINNTFLNGELTYDLTGVGDNGTKIADITGESINKTNGTLKLGTGFFTKSDGDTHVYTLKIYFKDIGEDQNYNQEAVFNAKFTVLEAGKLTAFNNCFNGAPKIESYSINEEECSEMLASFANFTTEQVNTFCSGGEIEFGNGNMLSIGTLVEEDPTFVIENNLIENIDYSDELFPSHNDYVNGQYTYTFVEGNYGWRVTLTDKESTNPVTTKLCTYINDEPIISMASMFRNSQATSIDLSSFDTSKVTNMQAMFSSSQATSLDLSSFDTSKVTSMRSMFDSIQATSLDVSGFDTSNVKDMSYMFVGSQATTLDLSSFDTSKVTALIGMFMSMPNITILDLSSFDTSKVTNISNMFDSCSELTTIYVSDKWNLSSLSDTGDVSVFRGNYNLIGGAGTTWQQSMQRREYAHIDEGSSNPGLFTAIEDR